VTNRVPPPAARRTGAATCAATTAPRTSTSWAVRSRLHGGVEDLAWIRQGSVVHDYTGGPRGAEDPFERLAVAVQILDIRADRLYLKAAAAQFRGELVDGLTMGDECAAEALAAEAPNHAGADPWSRADQQEMLGVNRLGHIHLRVELSPGLSAWAAVPVVDSPD
jgi:hypothetical protein